MKKTIGIIGMGVSGLAVLLALSRKKEKELKQLAIFVLMILSTLDEEFLFKKTLTQL